MTAGELYDIWCGAVYIFECSRGKDVGNSGPIRDLMIDVQFTFMNTTGLMYPTPQEKAIVNEAEKLMVEIMARYDPSHDKYHGRRGKRYLWQ